jgi:CheY-like chemotaxis protein
VESNNKILYVDDEESWRVVFKRSLQDVYEVITAKNADEGWEQLKKNSDQISIIVCDQRMPGRPGIELLKQARAYYPHIIRIMTTGFSDASIAINATNQGAVYHYISKPWNAEELVSILKRAMDYFTIRQERDLLMERKLSSIQRKLVESKLQCLLVFAVSRQKEVRQAIPALSCYLGSIMVDPGRIFDIKAIYRRSQTEFSNLISNLNLVREIMEVPRKLSALPEGEKVNLSRVLLALREGFPQLIFSIRTIPASETKSCNASEQQLLSCLQNLLKLWMEDQGNRKLLEVTEGAPVGDKPVYQLRLGLFTDAVPYVPTESECYNGINLPEQGEIAWLTLLFVAHHLGVRITPDLLSDSRISFSFGTAEDLPSSQPPADLIIAELLHKFEAWNYANRT